MYPHKLAIYLFIFFLLLKSIPFLKAQKIFSLSGEIIGLDSGKIVLKYQNSSAAWHIDTSRIVNGRFLFKDTIIEPTRCALYTLGEDNFASIYIEPLNQRIKLKNRDFARFKMEGTFTQKQSDTLNWQMSKTLAGSSQLGALYDSLNIIYITEKDSIVKANLLDSMESIQSRLYLYSDNTIKIQVEFIKQHPNSYVSINNLRDLFVTYKKIDCEQATQLYNSLTKRLKYSIEGKIVFNQLDKQKKSNAGSQVGNINSKDINNDTFKISNLLGKYVLIDFWASWCKPCREAIPHLKDIYRLYNKKDLKILMISIDENDNNWRRAVRDEQIDFLYNIIINQQIKNNYANSEMPIPNQILIDKNGTILWNSIYSENTQSLDSIISEMLK